MTLKENFENIIYNYIGSEWDRRDVSNSLENDAEDFAIGFGQWLIKKEHEYTNKIIAMEELLEIYKKENQL